MTDANDFSKDALTLDNNAATSANAKIIKAAAIFFLIALPVFLILNLIINPLESYTLTEQDVAAQAAHNVTGLLVVILGVLSVGVLSVITLTALVWKKLVATSTAVGGSVSV